MAKILSIMILVFVGGIFALMILIALAPYLVILLCVIVIGCLVFLGVGSHELIKGKSPSDKDRLT